MAQKAKKKSKLRHAEYYDMQKTFDSLYADSKSGEVFGHLMDIISAPSNIKLAFRNIKGNDGSHTAGTDGRTIESLAVMPEDKFVKLIQKQFRRYEPKAVKSVDPNVSYGISPAGNIDNLTSKYSYYVDIYKWLNSTEYVDYICPQVYWGFKHPTAKFNKVTDRWIKAAKSKKVKLYIGIAVYRAGHNVGQNRAERKEWKSDTKVLKKQVQYARKKHVDGFAFFDYQDLKSKTSAKAVNQLKTVLK